MRTIKFRGKKTTNDVWVYGSFVCSNDLDAAIYYQKGNGSVKSMDWVYVKPETIGQYTGLLDKNGKEIYEGDIITCINKSDSVYEIGRQMIGFVAYEENGCYWFCKNNFQHYNDWAFADDIEVIGNIYDNKDLIKGE